MLEGPRLFTQGKLSMGVTVCLPLFGNPGHELEEGAAAKGKDLRDLADALRDRLVQAAATLDKLTADGWAAQVAMFDLIVSHPQISTKEDVEQRLRSLEIDPEPFLIIEDVEEEGDDA
jgi:hypothetical protein